MSVFDTVRENVTARQVFEYYGIRVNRYGMCSCPFHSDKHPSMKVDTRYYCFGCGEKGDAVDFVSKYFGLGLKDAAIKICDTLLFMEKQKSKWNYKSCAYVPKSSKDKGYIGFSMCLSSA